MKKISNKPKDWVKAFLITQIIFTIICLSIDKKSLLVIMILNLFAGLWGYLLFEAINVLIYNKRVKDRNKFNYESDKFKQKRKELSEIQNKAFLDLLFKNNIK